MDSFYNKDTVISQLFLLVPVAPGPRVKAEMRNGYSFSLKKLVKLLTEAGAALTPENIRALGDIA